MEKRMFLFCLVYVSIISMISKETFCIYQKDQVVESNQFQIWNFIKTELSTSSEQNAIISPLSMELTMSILSRALNFEGNAYEEIKNLFPRLEFSYVTQMLTNFLKTSRSIGNNVCLNQTKFRIRFFVQKDYQVYGSYDNMVEYVDFENKTETVGKVNNWSKNTTKGFITDVITESDIKYAVLLLINSAFFKGRFEYALNLLPNDKFRMDNGETTEIFTMFNHIELMHFESDKYNAEMLALPFANSNISMVILLPKEGENILNFIQKLDYNLVSSMESSLRKELILIFLPKLKYFYKFSVKESLDKLNITRLFANDTKFPALVPYKINISDYIQKTGIEINENGTKPGINLISYESEGYSIFDARRPFVFYIKDFYNNFVLFAGIVNKPSA